jgi:hypothetical protein
MITMRNIEFKVRLSPDEHDRLIKAAEECGLRRADYVRYSLFGPSGSDKVPYYRELKEILFTLSRLGDNVNRCMHAIHRSEKKDTLSPAQFKAMHEAIETGLKEWVEPKKTWLRLLKELRK